MRISDWSSDVCSSDLRPLGDVILALETVEREAAGQGKPAADHLCHLVVHGVLHLYGYDHETEAEAEEMEDVERTVLAGLGTPDPYADEPSEPARDGKIGRAACRERVCQDG